MKVQNVAVKDLVSDPANVRVHGERNLEAIKGSLKAFGQQKPIVVDAKGIVIAGNGTLAAAKELGWAEVKVVRTTLTGSEARAFAIADNRTAELAEWDLPALKDLLKEVEVPGFDLTLDFPDVPEISEVRQPTIAPNLKPIIAYYGGKQRLASRILPLIPRYDVYAEPFCGGAALLFALPKISGYEVVNDHSKDLVNMYRCFQDHPKKMLHKLRLTLYSEQECCDAIRLLKEKEFSDDMATSEKLCRACAYYVSVVQSFGCIQGGSFGRMSPSQLRARPPSRSRSRSLYGWLGYSLARFHKVQVSCEDAFNFIKRTDGPNVFFFIDPPYPGTDQGHYSGWSLDDHKRLIDLCSSLKASFIMTQYGDFDVPANWDVFKLNTFSSVAAWNSTKELRTRVETVYRKLAEGQTEFVPMFDVREWSGYETEISRIQKEMKEEMEENLRDLESDSEFDDEEGEG